MTRSEKTRAVGELELRRLAAMHGIRTEWRDALGGHHVQSGDALRAGLSLCGLSVQSDDAIRHALEIAEKQVLQPMYVVGARPTYDPQSVSVHVPEQVKKFAWTLTDGKGIKFSGEQELRSPRRFGTIGGAAGTIAVGVQLPPLDPGYYKFQVRWSDSDGEGRFETRVIASPAQCYVPKHIQKSTWGLLVRTSSLRSSRNWGVGDFTDLADLCKNAFQKGGAGIIMLEPIQPIVAARGHESALFTSLSFIDAIYIDVESVQEYSEHEEAKRKVLSPEFQQRLTAARTADQVDFAAVRASKLAVLELLYQKFRQEHLQSITARARNFRAFQARLGSSLKLWSLHEALSEHLQDNAWENWTDQYKTPDAPGVREFEQANAERVEFFQYLQWVAEEQLNSVLSLCDLAEVSVGICATVPLSIDPSGFESWRNQDIIAAGVAAGMPGPTELPTVVQEAALIPAVLRSIGYAPYAEAIRSAMRRSHCIYLPDIAALERRIWIPKDQSEAIDVQYDFNELIGILKYESNAAQCAVIASGFEHLDRTEDADNDDIVERLGILPGTQYFQPNFGLIAPDLPQISPFLITPSGGVFKTLLSYWFGADVPAPDLNTEEGKAMRDAVVAQRVLDRVNVLRRLEEASLLPSDVVVDPASASVLTVDVATAFYKLLASQPSRILMVGLEDIAGKQVVEKSVTAYSVRQRLALDIPEVFEQEPVLGLLDKLRASGRVGETVQENVDTALKLQARIPHATYRFQFHKDFKLSQAVDLVSYLEALGISDLYASPLLVARPGSMHGYDIVNHKSLNPELGTQEDLDNLSEELKSHKMGLVLDMVPNHMGIGRDNSWWMDVLENGPASQFADYFDIDWTPIKPELRGKVTIPVLGDSYGSILASGQLKLHFYPERGALSVRYYENEYPLNPLTYPAVLNERIEILKERLGADSFDLMEYQSIITAFSHLPGHMEPTGFSERIREKQLQMRRLSELCKRNPAITEFIEQNLKLFEVQGADRLAIQRMHGILEAQAYRLVHWRVANDEINYRRFFDVNDLAAVRTEDPRVFTEMHALVMKWVAEHKITGLRIDHPDGLFDPAAYFNQLQMAAAEKLGGSFRPTSSDKHDLPFYILVEKILAPFERLEEDWAAQGTTGYDYLNEVLNVLIRPESEEEFSRIYQSVVGGEIDYEEMKRECKRIILDSVLASELIVLAHRLSRIAESSWYFRDFTLNSLRYALRQLTIAFPVYRTYVTPEKVDKAARQFIDWAVGKAKRTGAASSTAVYDFIRSVLTLEAAASPLETDADQNVEFKQAVQTFAMKFQQFTGPVMAKSFEDTLFYRYVRFAGLNEVGGEPDRFGVSLSAFHQKNQQRQQRQPYSMLATSTHDTKRSEDVRARLAVLSELPKIWEQRVNLWMRMNKPRKVVFESDNSAPDNNDEYLLYQTIVGALPLELSNDEELAEFRERIKQYMLKAVREAKRLTSWMNQNSDYENGLTTFIDRILTPSSTNAFLEDIKQFQNVLAPLGLLNGLVQTILKLTCPGVPDIYQGNELWDFSLVDPDNRRPVNYDLRRRMLSEMERHVGAVDSINETSGRSDNEAARAGFVVDCMRNINDGRSKLYTIACILRYRRSAADLFTDGKYIPLEVTGKAADHVIAFARELNGQLAIIVVPHLVATLLDMDNADNFKHIVFENQLVKQDLWGDTTIRLPQHFASDRFVNLFTSEKLDAEDKQLLVAKLFNYIPVCVLAAS